MKENRKLLKILSIFIILIFASVFYQCSRGFIRTTIPKIEGAKYSGSKSCKGCHVDICMGLLKDFKKSVHGRLAKFEAVGVKKGCESCHGAGSAHIETEDPKKIIMPSKLNPAESSEICLQCHSKHYWRSSEHPINSVSCISCHKIHNSKEDALLVKSEPALCYDCHKDIRAKTLYPSHHPIWEQERTGRKRMTCNDCHDVHGSAVGKQLKVETGENDLCLKCHAKYQGPFIYEHAPVAEDCNICHDPHGSVANNLLKQNEPFICMQCHELHFHVGKESTAGDFSSSTHQNILQNNSNELPVDHGSFTANSFKKAFATKCTQCHPQIHGSDLPSQSVSGRGNSLTR